MTKSIINDSRILESFVSVYQKASQRKNQVQSEIAGVKFTSLPKVFSIVDFPEGTVVSTHIFAQALPNIVRNLSFLEVGSGTGILSVVVALNSTNPENILATDINPGAVANTLLNFEKYKLPCKVRQSDVFDQVLKGEKFDFIFWNHPFSDLDISAFGLNQAIRLGGFDPGYVALEKYFRDANKHLSPNGKILLGTNVEVSNWDKILDLAGKYDFLNEPNIIYSQKTPSRSNLQIMTETVIVEFS